MFLKWLAFWNCPQPDADDLCAQSLVAAVVLDDDDGAVDDLYCDVAFKSAGLLSVGLDMTP